MARTESLTHDEKQVIGSTLASLRQYYRFTQEVTADILDTSSNTVYLLEHARLKLSPGKAVDLLETLGGTELVPVTLVQQTISQIPPLTAESLYRMHLEWARTDPRGGLYRHGLETEIATATGLNRQTVGRRIRQERLDNQPHR